MEAISPVTDPVILGLLKESVRDQIIQVNGRIGRQVDRWIYTWQMNGLIKLMDSTIMIFSIILQIDLKKLGVTDYGELHSGQLGNCNNNKSDLYADPMVSQFPHKPVPFVNDVCYNTQLGKNMMLARYPNLDTEGKWQWLSAGKVTDKQKGFSFNTSR